MPYISKHYFSKSAIAHLTPILTLRNTHNSQFSRFKLVKYQIHKTSAKGKMQNTFISLCQQCNGFSRSPVSSWWSVTIWLLTTSRVTDHQVRKKILRARQERDARRKWVERAALLSKKIIFTRCIVYRKKLVRSAKTVHFGQITPHFSCSWAGKLDFWHCRDLSGQEHL